jgi:hypothetical protein
VHVARDLEGHRSVTRVEHDAWSPSFADVNIGALGAKVQRDRDLAAPIRRSTPFLPASGERVVRACPRIREVLRLSGQIAVERSLLVGGELAPAPLLDAETPGG